MTDAKKPSEVPTALLADDFLEWLISRNGEESICPICKYRSWTLLTDDDGHQSAMVGLMTYPATVGNMGWGKPVIQIECKRCAYLAFFAASTVDEWLKKGKPPFVEERKNG